MMDQFIFGKVKLQENKVMTQWSPALPKTDPKVLMFFIQEVKTET